MESSSASAARRRSQLAAQGAEAYAASIRLVESLQASSWDADELADLECQPSTDLRTLDGQLTILAGMMRELLRDSGHELGREHVVELSETLHAVHQVRFSIHDLLGHERLRRMDQLDRELTRLRRITDQDELLVKVCESAAVGGGFDRVMLSRVDEGTWAPWRSFAVQFGPAEQAFADWIRQVPRIELSHMLLESEVVRRREPAIVTDASVDSRVYQPLAKAAQQASYVVAPLIAGDRVVGLLHADNRGHDVVELDRDIVWFYAIGFAQIFERAVLLGRLRDQRAEVLRVMQTVETVLSDLASSEIDLATREETNALTVSRPVRPVAAERAQVLEALLTSRELEVLTLMATGATNDRIAQRLVIAVGTVKSHVKQILRKLRVENRAEAISQYLRLTIGARED
jgi:DNA-binding CsgD family transcriptional regulator